jgi:WD40 repeat protein
VHDWEGGWLVSVHESTNGVLLASQFFSRQVHRISWHPSGRWLAAPDAGGNVHMMDAESGQTSLLGQHKVDAVQTWFSPDGAYVMSGGWDKEIICWDAEARRRAITISLDSFVMQFNHDGRRCAVLTSTGVRLHTFERPSGYREFGENLGTHLEHVAFSPDGRWLAASAEKRMGVWDLSHDGPGAVTDQGYEAAPGFTADGRELFASRSNARDTDAFRWRITPGAGPEVPPELKALPLHKPRDMTYLTVWSNSVVITGSEGSRLLAPEQIETGPERWLHTMSGLNGVSPEGRWLGVYQPFGRALSVYRLPGLELAATLSQAGSIGQFAFSPREDEVAVASRAGVDFWSALTWKRTRSLTNFDRILYALDGGSLWLRKDLRTAGLYDGHSLAPLVLLPTDMIPLAVSPDGGSLAVSVEGRRLQLWDLAALRRQFHELGLDWARATPESR